MAWPCHRFIRIFLSFTLLSIDPKHVYHAAVYLYKSRDWIHLIIGVRLFNFERNTPFVNPIDLRMKVEQSFNGHARELKKNILESKFEYVWYLELKSGNWNLRNTSVFLNRGFISWLIKRSWSQGKFELNLRKTFSETEFEQCRKQQIYLERDTELNEYFFIYVSAKSCFTSFDFIQV